MCVIVYIRMYMYAYAHAHTQMPTCIRAQFARQYVPVCPHLFTLSVPALEVTCGVLTKCYMRAYNTKHTCIHRRVQGVLMTLEFFAAHRVQDTMEDSSTSTNVQALAASSGYINAVRTCSCAGSCRHVILRVVHLMYRPVSR